MHMLTWSKFSLVPWSNVQTHTFKQKHVYLKRDNIPKGHIFNNMNNSVTEMIANLGWDTLQKRRDLARLSMMYRIVHELVDIPVEPYLTPSTSMTTGHDSRFQQIRTSNATYQHSFFPGTIVLWNQTAVSQTTLEAFQNQLAIHTF